MDSSAQTALILAGGLGTRLAPVLPPGLPKALVELGGRPFLAHVLEFLGGFGVKNAVLCTGYGAGAVRDALGGSYGGVKLLHSVEKEPLGTAGALRAALPLALGDPLLAANGDSLVAADLSVFLKGFLESKALAGMVLVEVPDASAFGRVETDESGRVSAFCEKDGKKAPGFVNAGLYIFRREFLAAIPAGRPVSLEREIFPRAVETGLFGWKTRASFIDIGSPESYEAAKKALS